MLKRENKTDVIIVGTGPAGISCAITLARAGKEVILIERGLFAGSKNVFGGAIYTQATKKFSRTLKQKLQLKDAISNIILQYLAKKIQQQ